MNFIAKTLAGLEPVLMEELKNIGAEEIRPGKRAVFFEGTLETMYRANLELRTALRILTPISELRVRNEDDLYRKIQTIDWSEYLEVEGTLAVDAVVASELLRHSKYVALKTKDAIVDQFREKTGERPNVDINNPDLRINIHVHDSDVTVALDSSGDSLHRRGYRVDSVDAPINEVLAAGMILLSGWQKDCLFLDPMCGSGTIAIEAALFAYNIPPQQFREHFGFMNWKNFDPELWEQVKKNAEDARVDFKFPIYAYDKDFRAFKVANMNAIAAGLEGKILIERAAFEKLNPPAGPGILMMNPPYDERLPIEQAEDFYQSIGDRFKQAYPGYSAWVISSNLDALKSIGLRPSRRFSLINGKLDCKFLKFDLYAGSKRQPKDEATDQD